MKYKKKVYKTIKSKRASSLRREYDFLNSLFISIMVAIPLVYLEAFKDFISTGFDSPLVAVDILFVFILTRGIVIVFIIRSCKYTSLRIKEECIPLTKNKAYKILDEEDLE